MTTENAFTLCFTAEQGQLLTGALYCLGRRMDREQRHKEKQAEHAAKTGDVARAARIVQAFDDRQKKLRAVKALRETIQRSMEGI